MKRGLTKKHRDFRERLAEFKAKTREMIQSAKLKTDGSEKTVLQLLMKTQEDNLDPNYTYTDEMILDEFIIFIGAGSETTCLTILYSLYFMDKYPVYKDLLREEILKYYSKETNLTHDTLNKLDLLGAFIKEVLRYISPSPSPHPKLCPEDREIGKYKILKGTGIVPMFGFNNFNPKYYNEPEKFSPERWMQDSSRKDPYIYIPFSAGPRNCIGQNFAMNEIKVALAEFLMKFEFEVEKGFELVLVNRVVVSPKVDIPFILKPLEYVNK